MSEAVEKSWFKSLAVYLDKRSITMLMLGFSAGLPLLLIFSSLSLWLREAGVERAAVTYFSWAALGYSFKFVWSPLVDKLPIPFLTKALGRRRSWLLTSQIFIMASICAMALIDPSASENSLTYMAIAAVVLGFSSATQDIAIDAFRIESAVASLQATLSATYIAGYRMGMIVAGAGSLFLADHLGSKLDAYSYKAWMLTYFVMAACMVVGVVTTLVRPEPETKVKLEKTSTKADLSFFGLFLVVVTCFVATFSAAGGYLVPLQLFITPVLGSEVVASFFTSALQLTIAIGVAVLVSFALGKSNIADTTRIKEGYVAPVKNFFERYGTSLAWLLLALVGMYRISDIVLGVISNVFYQDMGFTKSQIATAVKTYGVFMSLLGGFLGGVLTTRYGVIRMLWWGAILSAATNLLFMLLARSGDSTFMLYTVISADNLAAGLASAAFIAFLSSLTDVSFTAVQYAIFSSLMTLLPKVLGGYSGSIVDATGYEWFFVFTAVIGLPVLWVVHLCSKRFKLKE
jgi:MFS transporter, PAT family, beta-lactamase induction signal transducer AmpG